MCPTIALPGCEAYLGFDWRTIALLWSDARQRYSDPRFMHLIFATLMRNPNVSSIAQEAGFIVRE